MKVSELNIEYDKLQLEYGAKELRSIYNGGCDDNLDYCFVFMNPTGRNIASDLNWKGRRSPWIGIKNLLIKCMIMLKNINILLQIWVDVLR